VSNPNEDPKKNFNLEIPKNEIITVDETGKVVIRDPELAKMSEELSSEELDAVAGGRAAAQEDGNLGCGLGC
jgi:hypothetical protein